MDDIVLRGMAKWPNVPAVYGWLRLDRRGDWWIRDERVAHPAILAYIGRNYAHDDQGRWFFQNGPQRVFVALAYTPFAFRVVSTEGAPLELAAHTGRAVSEVSGAWIDEDGALLLANELGLGALDDRDLSRLPPYLVDADGAVLSEDALEARMECLQRGERAQVLLTYGSAALGVGTIRRAEVPGRFGFVQDPQPAAGE